MERLPDIIINYKIVILKTFHIFKIHTNFRIRNRYILCTKLLSFISRKIEGTSQGIYICFCH